MTQCILGIDPGLKATGYGFIEKDHIYPQKFRILEVGTINPKAKDPIQYKMLKIHTILSDMIKQHKPEILVLEKIYTHTKHPATASILGHVRGVICLLSSQLNLELVELSVKRVRKSLTGNGNASKVQTRKTVSYTLNVDENKLTLDASDALALALGYLRMSQHAVTF